MDKNGNPKVQNVSKVLFQGDTEPKNINLNHATIELDRKFLTEQLTKYTIP